MEDSVSYGQYKKLYDVLKALVDRLDEIEADDSYKHLFYLAFVTGMKYTGPNWLDQLKAAKRILKGEPNALPDERTGSST